MLDYQMIRVPAYDGTRRTVPSIEVFDCTTGNAVAFCRHRPFESRSDWIARAFANAELALAS